MDKYNKSAQCFKCGDKKEVAIRYCRKPMVGSLCGRHAGVEDNQEHMHRICTKCKYEWLEWCLDFNIKEKN